MSRNVTFCSAWLLAIWFLISDLTPALRAQSAAPTMPGRFLLIFDISSDMKRREPAVEKSLQAMLVTSMNGQLHRGDTLGVWTFNQDLHLGDYPLQVWNPENAAMITSNLMHFIHTQKYANAARYAVLQPLLNRVVASSERLTVLLFTGGATKVSGTTFDNGVNEVFEKNAAAQQKARQPFVVLLRSQQGKYVGCTVNFAPQLVNFPEFPPLPEPPPPPPKPEPKPEPAPQAAPTIVGPSMIIKGTKVEIIPPGATNPPPVAEPAPAVVALTNAPVVVQAVLPPVAPEVPTNPAPIAVAPEPTNPPAIVAISPPIEPTNVAVTLPTNEPVTSKPVAPVESPAGVDKKPLIIGAVCLLVATILAGVIFFRFRRPTAGSLISRSMDDR
jgi:hypothetical protein